MAKTKKQEHALERTGTKSLQTNVLTRINEMVEAGEISFPKNYSAGNAVKSAFLILQDTRDKDGNPVLDTCTPASISNAVLKTVITGLAPAKKQCYYIAYGKSLTMMPSYFGDVAVAKSVDPRIIDFYAMPVYKGDKFAFEIKRASKQITKHIQTLETIDEGTICAAYATVVYRDKDGEVQEYSDVMTWAQIKKAWSRGKTKGASSAHTDQPEEMARRTITKRVAKWFINTSGDQELDFRVLAYNQSNDAIDDDSDGFNAQPGDTVTIDSTAEDIIDVDALEIIPDDKKPDNPQPTKAPKTLAFDDNPGY